MLGVEAQGWYWELAGSLLSGVGEVCLDDLLRTGSALLDVDF